MTITALASVPSSVPVQSVRIDIEGFTQHADRTTRRKIGRIHHDAGGYSQVTEPPAKPLPGHSRDSKDRASEATAPASVLWRKPDPTSGLRGGDE